MSHIMTKLGVHSQLQALVFAIKYGVVKIPIMVSHTVALISALGATVSLLAYY